ncbi:MAG: phosphoribosyltransferase family protein [Thermodesulfobacteriota bacterium]|nr:phosphoribosyltransferase family protein [Thermodesulfobacteriota bacterium]
MKSKFYDIPQLRQKLGIFQDRRHAGQVLAEMLHEWQDSKALVLAVPSGGMPVAVEVAETLDLSLDVAVVSKILLPWNTEAGFGAVGFDGSVWINREYVDYYRLDQPTIEQQTEAALKKVQRRVKLFRGDRPWPDLQNRPVIVVDDGIAAGSTLRVAVLALRNTGAMEIIVAVPTAHEESLARIMDGVDALYCANIRSGPQFAVAAAYRHWDDVDEVDADRMLVSYRDRESTQ